MSRFFSIIIIFGILLVGGGWLWMRKADDEARMKIEETLASARRTFSDKARAAVREEDEQDYLRGIKAALADYESELKKNVYKDKPDWRDADAYVKQVETRFKEGELQEAQKKSMLEGYEIVKDAHKTLQAATWTPVLSQASGGDTRIDIYGMKRTRDPDGNPLLEGKALFWGIEDTTRMNWGQLNLRYWVKRKKMVKKGRRKVEEEVEEVEEDVVARLLASALSVIDAGDDLDRPDRGQDARSSFQQTHYDGGGSRQVHSKADVRDEVACEPEPPPKLHRVERKLLTFR